MVLREKKMKKEIKEDNEKSTQNKELLRKVMVKIGLERVVIQEEITIEALLDSSTIGLVMSPEFVRKQEFKLKKTERLIYIRNINSSFNKERLIDYMVVVNIYY